jgi:hypothetical protein
MNPDQIALYNKAGEFARLFQEQNRKRLEEPSPDRPWFFHPLGWCIEVGFTSARPEYDRPKAKIDSRTETFAQRIGMLAQTTQIWLDTNAMVSYLSLAYRIFAYRRISRDHFYLLIWSMRLED